MLSESVSVMMSDQSVVGTTMTPLTELTCAIKKGVKAYLLYFIIFQQDSVLDHMKLELMAPNNMDVFSYNIFMPTVIAGIDGNVISHNRVCAGTTLGAANTDYLCFVNAVMFSGSASGNTYPQVASTGILSTVKVKAGSALHVFIT